MKVVVTGGMGKLGRYVVEELLSGAEGTPPHEVKVFDQTRGPQADRVRCLAGDIRGDLGQVFEALAGAEAVIHLAAVPTHGIATDAVTFATNVMGTFNVHEAAWRLGIRRVVTMSSEAVLGWAPDSWLREHAPEYLPIDEDHPLRPQDAYGLSKQASEVIARSYTEKGGMQTVILRPPWIVSPEEMQSLRRTGGVTPTRFALYHYVDVRDLAQACRLAVEVPLAGSHTLFVGAGETCISEPLCTLYPRLMPAIGDKAAGLTGARSAVSIDRTRKVLGWSPKCSWRKDEG
ncbi:MAG: NAD(P)-dependent oxidoreductase [Betaproteobacteria bacterium]|nr:NAD(P)-dependent oxidoreductase [Betaproteobacteria bacterium]